MSASDRIQPGQSQLKTLPLAGEHKSRRLSFIGNAYAPFVASVAVTVGIGLGWLLRGLDNDETSARPFVKMENARLIAAPPLKAALDTIPSSNRLSLVPGGKPAQFRALMTFSGQDRGYCRQYELALGAQEWMAGIACRVPSGDWWVLLQSPKAPSTPGRIVPASGPNAVFDAAINALIQGDPLGAEAEAAIISNGWRK
jgi:hypothetical protein